MTQVFFIFSFDDSSKYVLLCARLLEKFGFKGTFYLDIANLRKISVRSIRDLYLSGHEIGSHTVTHRDLTKLSYEEARQELIRSKKILEEITGFEIKSLAYPFGRYNRKVIRLVKEAGYDNARTTRPYVLYGLHKQGKYTLGVTFYTDPHALRSLPEAILRLRYFSLLRKPMLLKDYYSLIVNFVEYVVRKRSISTIGIHILCHPHFLAERGEFNVFRDLLEVLTSYSNKSLTVSEAVNVFKLT